MTTVLVQCPYAAQTVELEYAATSHPSGLHRCTQQIPPGGDHLGEHTCTCGAAFVVTSAVRPAGSLVWSDNPTAGATVVHTAAPPDGLVYLMWSQSHGAWWKPDARGYTTVLDDAGRFTETDAVRYTVASSLSGIRDKVSFMVAAPDNWDDVRDAAMLKKTPTSGTS